jgi:hypothetical protein
MKLQSSLEAGLEAQALTAAQERVMNRLAQLVEALQSGLRQTTDADQALSEALRRQGIFFVDLPRAIPFMPGEGVPDRALTPELLFGRRVNQRPGPLPFQAARLVYHGVKPACIVHGTEEELTRVCQLAFGHGLIGLLTPWEMVLRADPTKAGFSNLPQTIRPARPGSGGWRQLVIARDEGYALLAWVATTYCWDSLLGYALGYPSCCINRFARHWDQAVQEHGGEFAELLLQDDPGSAVDWRLNVLGRYRGARVLHHFPCSWECERSRRLAGLYLRCLAEHEPQTVAALTEALRCPYLYSREHGVVSLPGADVHAAGQQWHIAYDPTRLCCTCPESELVVLARRTRSLAARSTAIEILDRCFEARLILFV